MCIIEHTRNAQESLVLQGQGLGTSRKTLRMDGFVQGSSSIATSDRHLSDLSDCRTSRLTVYDSDGACSQSDLLSELSDSCRTPVGLSDCRNCQTVGLLPDYCRNSLSDCRTGAQAFVTARNVIRLQL